MILGFVTFKQTESPCESVDRHRLTKLAGRESGGGGCRGEVLLREMGEGIAKIDRKMLHVKKQRQLQAAERHLEIVGNIYVFS